MSASIRGLRPGDSQHESLLVERSGEEAGDWYIQVWRRPEGVFQLEYREGVAAEHYQARTGSVEQVVEAFFGWIDRDPAWVRGFEWTNIGMWFERSPEGVERQIDPLSGEDSGS